MQRRFEESLSVLKEAEHLRVEHKGPRIMSAAVYAHLGRVDEARDEYERLGMTTFKIVLGMFRNPDNRELLRSGLALAGANV
jgi:hypothetical protein